MNTGFRFPVLSFDFDCPSVPVEFQGLGQWRLDNDARAPSLLDHLKSISKDVNMFQTDSSGRDFLHL